MGASYIVREDKHRCRDTSSVPNGTPNTSILHQPDGYCGLILLPNLDSEKEDQCDARYNEQRDNFSAAPVVTSATPLQGKYQANDGWNQA
jgi:hypothetical protein